MKSCLEYKGYYATVEYSYEDCVLYGKIAGLNDLVTFECGNAAGAQQAFENAVDEYIAFCAEVGKEPEKAYKGSFNIRTTPQMHRALAQLAAKMGRTLNQVATDAFENLLTEKCLWHRNEDWQQRSSEAGVVDIEASLSVGWAQQSYRGPVQ